jgi:hypothetical protein
VAASERDKQARPDVVQAPGLTGLGSLGRFSATNALALQRSVGNQAVLHLLRGDLIVQRTPKLDKGQLSMLRLTMDNLGPFADEIYRLARDPALISVLAYTYGVIEVGANDTARTKPVPPNMMPLVTAAKAVGLEVNSSPVSRQTFEGAFDQKHAKKQLRKEQLPLFDAVAVVWHEFSALYQDQQPAGYEHKVGAVGGALGNQAETTREVLPARDVVAIAPGLLGNEMRRLTNPALNHQAITTADIDALYAAYNQSTWVYHTSASPSAHDLILGHSNKAVCGALAKALAETVNLVAKCRGLGSNPASLRFWPTTFVSKPYQWGFIDPAVAGNIESIAGGANGYANVNRVLWGRHTWMEALGHTYDPLGKQKDFDFRDQAFGNPSSDTAAGTWEAVPALNPPPQAFNAGFQLRQRA